MFYFAQLWACIQLLKAEWDSVASAASPIGDKLQRFIHQLETQDAPLGSGAHFAASRKVFTPHSEAGDGDWPLARR